MTDVTFPRHPVARRLLALLETRYGEFAERNKDVDKYAHSLQCATRVLHDGGPDDLVVAALFHDVFGGFSATDHGRMAAAVLEPFVSQETYECLHDHVEAMRLVCEPDFDAQSYIGSMRAIVFAARYDAPSFDSTYIHRSTSYFYRIIDRVIHD